MSTVAPPAPAAPTSTVRRRGLWTQAAHRLVRQPVPLAALVLLVVVLVAGELAPMLAPEGWNHLDLALRWQNHPPTLAGRHWLGTDNIGRDVLARTLWGLHYSEQAALVGALLATLLGVAVGGLAGFRGGWLDAILMRVADLVAGFPVIVLIIVAFAVIYQVTVWQATFVFALSLWTFVARVVRARVAALVPEEFVQAARSLGASERRVFVRHVLPNALGTVAVAATAVVGQILLVEATSEFFGYGVASLVRPTLGNLIAEATASGIGGNSTVGLGWWVWVAPAALLVLVLLCVNLAGDGLDAALNPRGRR